MSISFRTCNYDVLLVEVALAQQIALENSTDMLDSSGD